MNSFDFLVISKTKIKKTQIFKEIVNSNFETIFCSKTTKMYLHFTSLKRTRQSRSCVVVVVFVVAVVVVVVRRESFKVIFTKAHGVA